VIAVAIAQRLKTTVEHLSVPVDGSQRASRTARPHPRQSLSETE